MLEPIEVTPQIASLFANTHLSYMLEAMVVGNSPAIAWATPHSAMVWDKAHCVYLGGDANNETFIQNLETVIQHSLIPQAQALEILKIYDAHDAWKVDRLFGKFESKILPRTLYMTGTLPAPLPGVELPEGMRLRKIDERLLNDEALLNRDALMEEIHACWTSLDRFLQQGCGYYVVQDETEIICWCTAEYVSGKTCGVGIETVEAYQQKGVATATANAFMQDVVAKGWHVYWDSWQSNTPSVKIAEKLGFQKMADYNVRLVFLDD